LSYRVALSLPSTPSFGIALFRSQRLPNLTDIYWKEDIFATPNPDIKPETSIGYNLGFDARLDGAWGSNVRLSRFETLYDDLIIWRKWAGDKFKPVNLSKAKISGWELTIGALPFDGPFSLSWNGSFVRPANLEEQNVSHGKYLTFRPIGTQKAEIGLEAASLRAAVAVRQIGRRYMTEENTKSLPPVIIADMFMEYSFHLRICDIKTSFAIINLADKQYEILERNPEKPREFKIGMEISRIW
jgi:outer membrane cobalamin receptor